MVIMKINTVLKSALFIVIGLAILVVGMAIVIASMGV